MDKALNWQQMEVQDTTWKENTLLGWLAIGVMVQASFTLLPIGNYETLVYWLFYAPALLLLISYRGAVTDLLRRVDRPLLTALACLFLWLAISASWADGDKWKIAEEAAQSLLMITLYLTGVAFLAHRRPDFLLRALLIAGVLVALQGFLSAVDHYYLNDRPLRWRMPSVGFGAHQQKVNPVVAGIYLGAFTALIGSLMLNGVRSRGTGALLALCGLACLVATLLTGTRTAILGLLVVFVLILAIRRRWYLMGLLAGFCIWTISFGLLQESSWLHKFFMRGGLGGLRPELWAAAAEASLDNFFIGKGMWEEFQLTVDRDGWPLTQSHSHNFYLQLLNWSGAVGLCLYGAVLARALLLGWRWRAQALPLMALLVLTYFCVAQIFDVHNVFTTPSYYWPGLWLPLAILLAYPPGLGADRGKDAFS